jgi:hypothetical protein
MYRTKRRKEAIKMNSGFEQYVTLETAYRWLNCEFFEGKLPGAIITLTRHSGAYGYFATRRFAAKVARPDFTEADEIALNPDHFTREDIEVFSTLLHELVHQWQFHFGTPSRAGYHNREWADKMLEVGLTPSDTGQEGGKQTGQHMTHYITPGGRFASAFAQKLFKVEWASIEYPGAQLPPVGGPEPTAPGKGKKTPVSKQKFSCPQCGQNAWAKPSAHLVCGDCELDMIADL